MRHSLCACNVQVHIMGMQIHSVHAVPQLLQLESNELQACSGGSVHVHPMHKEVTFDRLDKLVHIPA